MKNFCIRVVAIFILLPHSGLGGVPETHQTDTRSKPALVFEATPSKPVYLRGEKIEFKFTLRNISAQTLAVTRGFGLTYSVNLEISDSQGKDVNWCGPIVGQIDSPSLYRTLSPGESVHSTVVISCVNGNDRSRAWGYEIEGPGKYNVKAVYQIPQPKSYFQKLFPNVRVDRGPFSATPVAVEVR